MTTYGIIITIVSIFILAIRFVTIKKKEEPKKPSRRERRAKAKAEEQEYKTKYKLESDVSWVPKTVFQEFIFATIVNMIFKK